MLLETVDLNNKIGYLFVVDIEFNVAKVDSKTLTCNEIYTPIFEEKEKISIFLLKVLTGV